MFKKVLVLLLVLLQAHTSYAQVVSTKTDVLETRCDGLSLQTIHYVKKDELVVYRFLIALDLQPVALVIVKEGRVVGTGSHPTWPFLPIPEIGDSFDKKKFLDEIIGALGLELWGEQFECDS